MCKDHQAILDFAIKYSGWHGFEPRCLDTANSVIYLKTLGLIETNSTNQFRAIVK